MTFKHNWSAEKRGYEKKSLGITGVRYPVLDIEPSQKGELGYTSAKKTIHLAHEHEAMKNLSEVEKIAFREGVFTHELLHQIFTDFAAFNRKLQGYPLSQRGIYSILVNVLEDPAIENFAHQVIGGNMLKSLRFTIAHIYKNSPRLEESTTPFGQYIAALINFGDMGLLKGNFTFPEARTVFNKTATLFAQGIEEPVCSKRLDIVKQIMEIAKPLWEEDAEKNEELQKALEELAKRNKSSMKGSGRGQSADEEDGSGSSKTAKRRKITIKKVSKEELEEMKKNGEIEEGDGSGSGELPEGDFTAVICDEETNDGEGKGKKGGKSIPIPGDANSESGSGEKGEMLEDCEIVMEGEDGDKKSSKSKKSENGEENGDEEKSNGESSSNGEKSNDGKENSENGKDGEETKGDKKSSGKTKDGENGNENKEGKSDEKEQKNNGSDSKNNPFLAPKTADAPKIGNVPTPDGFEESDETNTVGEISEDEYHLSEEDVERITKEAEKAQEEFAKEEHAEAVTTPIENFPVTSPKLGKRDCLNYRVAYNERDKEHLEEAYNRVISTLAPGIKTLTMQLRRIFENDYEEREYRNSGKINLKRVHSGRVTARVFDRRVAPTGKSDFCVELLVDESGSMSGRNKDVSARYCCIALSEVFANLGIPVYVIGFTADTQGHDIVHNHYITWKNTHNERLKLLNIAARANNCDGYSIRYATEVIKKNRSTNKLLIVLSDGQPAAHNYYDGVADTKQAIKDAKKQASVLGVAIGNSDTETIHYMYENDFLNVSNVEDLFAGLSRKLKQIMKSWGE